ncbi:survival protein sure-like phosphatase/nucleotidase [Fennellomyces sp. T-0311]|nr:survival protein sure-like phosphatase/nucleotidase [Fennellomyces sp. T-0311]
MTERPLKVLISNDDGPPSARESPFILSFIEHLESLGWDIKVCLPNTQKSWISKAFMIKEHIETTYYHRETGEIGPHRRGPSDFVLLNTTPATCVNIALNHIFKDEKFDLVIAGPNFGRNTATVSTLASGTIGAALEAVTCNQKAIALSFAIFSRDFSKDKIQCSIEMGTDVIRRLYYANEWPEYGMFNVNVPLSNEKRPVYLTTFHKGSYGSLFKPVEDKKPAAAKESVDSGDQAELDVRDEAEGHEQGGTVFRFAPDFRILGFLKDAEPGTDAWAIHNRYVSVTPMVASYEAIKTSIDYGFNTAGGKL